MFILKIRRTINAPKSTMMVPEATEENDIFIPADEVVAAGYVDDESMAAWSPDEWEDHRSSFMQVSDDGREGHTEKYRGRLLQVTTGKRERWLVVSVAWLMTSTGDTVERLA